MKVRMNLIFLLLILSSSCFEIILSFIFNNLKKLKWSYWVSG